jgi:hypothetical protein
MFIALKVTKLLQNVKNWWCEIKSSLFVIENDTYFIALLDTYKTAKHRSDLASTLSNTGLTAVYSSNGIQYCT